MTILLLGLIGQDLYDGTLGMRRWICRLYVRGSCMSTQSLLHETFDLSPKAVQVTVYLEVTHSFVDRRSCLFKGFVSPPGKIDEADEETHGARLLDVGQRKFFDVRGFVIRSYE